MPVAARAFPLSRFVENVRVITNADGRAHRVDVLPNGRTAIVFRVVERGLGDLVVVGPRTRALLEEASAFEQAIMLQLEPGWSSPLLGVAASELTDEFLTIEDVWGATGRGLRSALLEASSVPGRARPLRARVRGARLGRSSRRRHGSRAARCG